MGDDQRVRGLWVTRSVFWLVPPVFFLFFGIKAAVRHEWAADAVFGPFLLLSVVTIVWRLRSGMPTRPLGATVVGLLTGIRPTREGMVRKGAQPIPPERPVQPKERFEDVAGRLHAALEDGAPRGRSPGGVEEEQ